MEKIYSRKNHLLVHAKKLGTDKQYRITQGEYLCDGKKLLVEAVNSNVFIPNIFTAASLDISVPESTKVYAVDREILENISPLKNPQDVLFICKIPVYSPVNLSKGTHILLDNVQDPGNVGTIIRSADAFGIDSIILSEGCADIYNPKTVRASMGAIFRIKMTYMDYDTIKNIHARVIGATSEGKYPQVCKTDLSDCVIAMGNEGQGISDCVRSICNDMITIPLKTGCESLNVAIAASIIMYEVSKNENR